MKPIIHAENSVKKYGGKVEDYIQIHQFMDSSKGAMCDVRHRALTHTSWFIQPDGILEKVFGITITNSDGKKISVRDIGEDHILEDFDGFIPTPQDFLKDIPIKPWMNRGGGTPQTEELQTTKIIPTPPIFPPKIDPPPFIPWQDQIIIRDFTTLPHDASPTHLPTNSDVKIDHNIHMNLDQQFSVDLQEINNKLLFTD